MLSNNGGAVTKVQVLLVFVELRPVRAVDVLWNAEKSRKAHKAHTTTEDGQHKYES